MFDMLVIPALSASVELIFSMAEAMYFWWKGSPSRQKSGNVKYYSKRIETIFDAAVALCVTFIT